MAAGRPVELIPIIGIGDVTPGDDLVAILCDALEGVLRPGDILVVTHKVVSKAEGAVVEVDPDDPRSHAGVVEDEAARVVRRRGDLVIAITRHGFVCANAGVDRSNVHDGTVVLLPRDPDRSAHRLRTGLEQRFEGPIAVVVTDTFGRPWRRGVADIAIGVSGIDPIVDHRGQPDMYGRIMEVTEVAIVDELAAAADLVMGKADGIPAAVVRGLVWTPGTGRLADIVRPDNEDLFR
ncbi:MAG: coenzyme F420-0:L-glutamate ligase [Acidimicrobiia bacterium]|jgi:coenzyme F420-0:L-glutamate ligase/coenzyme F420-1:gamma-L-glutamate ligase|nr:MAG: coenzyme F420-0:L-glutamate ligase [Acidimicrobiia bacterium]